MSLNSPICAQLGYELGIIENILNWSHYHVHRIVVTKYVLFKCYIVLLKRVCVVYGSTWLWLICLSLIFPTSDSFLLSWHCILLISQILHFISFLFLSWRGKWFKWQNFEAVFCNGHLHIPVVLSSYLHFSCWPQWFLSFYFDLCH